MWKEQIVQLYTQDPNDHQKPFNWKARLATGRMQNQYIKISRLLNVPMTNILKKTK